MAYLYRQPYINLGDYAITGEYLPEGIFEGIELFILITIILLKVYFCFILGFLTLKNVEL